MLMQASFQEGPAVNTEIEMHDSSVVEVKQHDDGSGFVLLDAVIFRSEGLPGRDDGVCGVQTARFIFSNMTLEGDVGSGEPGIYHGSLEIDGIRHENMIPVPLLAQGTIALKMMLADDARLVTVHGESVSVQIEGEFRYETRWPRE